MRSRSRAWRGELCMHRIAQRLCSATFGRRKTGVMKELTSIAFLPSILPRSCALNAKFANDGRGRVAIKNVPSRVEFAYADEGRRSLEHSRQQKNEENRSKEVGRVVECTTCCCLLLTCLPPSFPFLLSPTFISKSLSLFPTTSPSSR